MAYIRGYDAGNGTAEIDIEKSGVETGAARAVLNARPDTLRRGKVDELHPKGDLRPGIASKRQCLRLVIVYAEIRRVLRSQYDGVLVRQNERPVGGPEIALEHVRGWVGDRLGSKSDYYWIKKAIYFTSTIKCLYGIYTICCNYQRRI